MQHRNATLGPAGRRKLVALIDGGMSEREAAASLSVARSTAHHWRIRRRQAGPEELASGGWAEGRSSRPRTSPRRVSATEEARICETRERLGWGPRLLAQELGRPHSTVHAVLRRHGRSRVPRRGREDACRYEWPCPGDLLHVDVAHYPRFARPGHAVTGDRSKTGAEKRARLGHDCAHAAVDDHSRLAFSELLADERAPTVTAWVERALDFYAARGVRVRRLMTDNAWAYTHNRSLAELLRARGVRHLTTRPYRPRTNGKVERFHQTMEREWAKGVVYASHDARNAALGPWLAHYNQRRPHSALGGRPPISRARNVSGHDT